MCTLVILRRPPGDDWPVLLAANRDEMMDRPWDPPARHWRDRKHVVAGRDRLAGGSWLGINDDGVVAGVLNRLGALGPLPGARSRGELVLEALDHADAVAAASALADLDPSSYRPFNLVIADNRDAFWLRNTGGGEEEGANPGCIEAEEIPLGLSMITACDRNDMSSARIRSYLPLFARAPQPDPDTGQWSAWESLLAGPVIEAESGLENGPEGAMTIRTGSAFGTVSSALIALRAPGAGALRAVWRFAPGPPDETAFAAVDLSG